MKPSIEQKAKAHDEAIERAKRMLSEKELNYIFPELKESEDERIRKAIIEFFELQDDNTTYSFVPKKDIIAWLEKQGEKHIDRELSNLLNRVIHRFINDSNIPYSERDEVSKKIIPYVEQLKKQGEQKPADKIEPKFKVGDTVKDPYGDLYHITEITDNSYKTDDGRFILFINQEVYTLSNFTAWSEEDEAKMKSILFHIEDVENKDVINWFKSLKDRVQSQNFIVTNKELAQAKKNAYNDALDKIEYHSGEPTFDDGWSAAIWYLKKRNTIPQSQWKPSDDEMEALANALSLAKNCGEESSFDLRTLYEQLKKLREE